MADIYADLKTATPEELLEAIYHAYMKEDFPVSKEFAKGMHFGFRLTQPDGWQLVSPIWLQNYRDSLKRPARWWN